MSGGHHIISIRLPLYIMWTVHKHVCCAVIAHGCMVYIYCTLWIAVISHVRCITVSHIVTSHIRCIFITYIQACINYTCAVYVVKHIIILCTLPVYVTLGIMHAQHEHLNRHIHSTNRAPQGGGGVPCYMLYGFSMGLLYAITKI